MTPEQLKISILTRAIEGKLVDQKAEEGDGHLLYQTFVEKHPIKKGKTEIIIERYAVPTSWRWCQFDRICEIVVGATPSTSNSSYWGGDIHWLPSGVCQDCEVHADDSHIKFITKDGYESCSTKMMEPGTVLIALTGATAGKVALLNFEACANQSVVGIKSYDNLIDQKFIFYTLMARKHEILSDCVGSAQPHISKEYVCNMSFALPPLKEQKRIVAKIEELLPLVDKYEEAWTKLKKFNNQFPIDMEKSILFAAINGRLTHQSKRETSAKNFQKDEIYNLNDIFFQIPSNWCWVKLKSVCNFKGGFAYKSSDYVKISNNYLLRLGNVKNNYLVFGEKSCYLPDSLAKETENFRVVEDDILVTMTGTRGKGDYFYTKLIDKNDITDRKLFLNQRVGCLKHKDCIIPKYLLLVLQSEFVRNRIFEKETGTANQGNIGSNDILNYIYIPVPPLEEQKRIVAKTEELLPLCRSFK